MECHKAFAQPFCRWPSSPKTTTFVSPPPCVCMVCIKGTDLIPCWSTWKRVTGGGSKVKQTKQQGDMNHLAKWNVIFHQLRFPWFFWGISLTQPPFWVKNSCEVAIQFDQIPLTPGWWKWRDPCHGSILIRGVASFSSPYIQQITKVNWALLRWEKYLVRKTLSFTLLMVEETLQQSSSLPTNWFHKNQPRKRR